MGKQRDRREVAGLSESQSSTFASSCEFVSLGNFCGVAHALRSLGLAKYAYPFDWNRSPLDGVIRLIKNDFTDFLSHSIFRDAGRKGRLFGGSNWGGSFWHHDITSQKVKDDFRRRIQRFYGRLEVPPSQPRVFVRAANTTEELDHVASLMSALRSSLRHAEIKILILIDLQSKTEVVRVADGVHKDVLFGRIHESLFAEATKHWTIEKHSQAYGEAIALATLVWAGISAAESQVHEVASLQDLRALCEKFDGGDTADDLFKPQRLCAPSRSAGEPNILESGTPVIQPQRSVLRGGSVTPLAAFLPQQSGSATHYAPAARHRELSRPVRASSPSTTVTVRCAEFRGCSVQSRTSSPFVQRPDVHILPRSPRVRAQQPRVQSPQSRTATPTRITGTSTVRVLWPERPSDARDLRHHSPVMQCRVRDGLDRHSVKIVHPVRGQRSPTTHIR